LRCEIQGQPATRRDRFNPDDVHVAFFTSHPNVPKSLVDSTVATKQIPPIRAHNHRTAEQRIIL